MLRRGAWSVVLLVPIVGPLMFGAFHGGSPGPHDRFSSSATARGTRQPLDMSTRWHSAAMRWSPSGELYAVGAVIGTSCFWASAIASSGAIPSRAGQPGNTPARKRPAQRRRGTVAPSRNRAALAALALGLAVVVGCGDGSDDAAVTPTPTAALQPQGARCGRDLECATGNCSKAVCCDQPCDRRDEYCNAPGRRGECLRGPTVPVRRKPTPARN